MELKINTQRIDRRAKRDPWDDDWDCEHEKRRKDRMQHRMEKRFNYDVDTFKCKSLVVKREAEQFHDKLGRYLGKEEYVRKRTAVDKRNAKQKYGLIVGQNPIYKQWKRVDDILRRRLMSVLFSYNKYRNRY